MIFFNFVSQILKLRIMKAGVNIIKEAHFSKGG
jgi:hypothetical protein